MKLSPGNCNKPEHYIELYGRLLEGRDPRRILEIGVQYGDSIRMWSDAFPQAEVVGLDIELRVGVFSPHTKLVQGKQSDTALLQSLGRFDFIVDDGSHMTSDQQTSFETLFPELNKGGIYVIEDFEVNREDEFKNTPLSTVEYFADLLTTVRHKEEYKLKFMREGIKSITFADNLIVIEKL